MLRNSSAGGEGASSSKDMAVRTFQVSPGWTVVSFPIAFVLVSNVD